MSRFRYNAVSMQALCLLIVPLVITVRRPRLGLCIVAAIGLLSTVYSAAVTFVWDAAPSVLMLPKHSLQVRRSSAYLVAGATRVACS